MINAGSHTMRWRDARANRWFAFIPMPFSNLQFNGGFNVYHVSPITWKRRTNIACRHYWLTMQRTKQTACKDATNACSQTLSRARPIRPFYSSNLSIFLPGPISMNGSIGTLRLCCQLLLFGPVRSLSRTFLHQVFVILVFRATMNNV